MCFAGCIANCGDRRAYRLYWRAELLRRAMSSYGPEAKQDYAVRLEGPMSKIFSSLSWKTCLDRARHDVVATSSQSGREPPAGRSAGILVWRDNEEHRDDIERHYLKISLRRGEKSLSPTPTSSPAIVFTRLA